MLIAVRKGLKSEAAAWKVKGQNGEMLLRVAIVFGEA